MARVEKRERERARYVLWCEVEVIYDVVLARVVRGVC